MNFMSCSSPWMRQSQEGEHLRIRAHNTHGAEDVTIMCFFHMALSDPTGCQFPAFTPTM